MSHVYVGYRPCGCADTFVVDDPNHASEVAEIVRDMQQQGLAVERTLTKYTLALLKQPRCPHVQHYRRDGWPLCPQCGDDELWSAMIPASLSDDLQCYACQWTGRITAHSHLGHAVPDVRRD